MIYKCKICEKEFNQKCHYTNHLNRIRPCEKLTKNLQQITPKYTNLTPKIQQITPKSKNCCNYCLKTYCRSNVLKKHLLICKVKKKEIEEKEEILNKLLEQNNKLVSTIEELNKRIDKLENEKKTNQTQNNRNIKNQNNGTINNNIIVGFGMEERCEEIKDDKNITDKKKTNMENKLKILQIMKDYEKEEEKERYDYLRNECKEKIKMDLYNNIEKIDD